MNDTAPLFNTGYLLALCLDVFSVIQRIFIVSLYMRTTKNKLLFRLNPVEKNSSQVFLGSKYTFGITILFPLRIYCMFRSFVAGIGESSGFGCDEVCI